MNILIIFVLTNCSLNLSDKSKPCLSINDALSLKLSLDTDTVFLGDSLNINLTFYNLTEKDIIFYKNGYLTLTHRNRENVLFVNPPIYDEIQIINEITDFREKTKLLKNETVQYSFKAIANKEIFFKDSTLIVVNYRINLNDSNEIHELKYCGTLESNYASVKVIGN